MGLGVCDAVGLLGLPPPFAGVFFPFAAAPSPHYFTWFFLAPLRAILRALGSSA